MSIDGELSNRFWGEAVLTANYLQNRLPSRKLSKTPFQLFHKKQPDLSHIQAFGCYPYVYVPKEKRSKLDVKAIKLKFVGYDAIYRILFGGF